MICEELKNLHQEVKFVENLNLIKATEQAERDGAGKPWVVAHKKNRTPWLVTMNAELFFRLLRDGMDTLATPAPLVSGEQGLGDPGR